eukprot:3658826-Rhodomonas_salina.1
MALRREGAAPVPRQCSGTLCCYGCPVLTYCVMLCCYASATCPVLACHIIVSRWCGIVLRKCPHLKSRYGRGLYLQVKSAMLLRAKLLRAGYAISGTDLERMAVPGTRARGGRGRNSGQSAMRLCVSQYKCLCTSMMLRASTERGVWPYAPASTDVGYGGTRSY